MENHIVQRHHKHLTGGIKAALAALAVLAVAVAPALADPSKGGNLGNPGIAPPQSHFRGLTYSEWSAEWFQWVFSLPSTHHPLLDTAECSAGQTDKVWFIDGTHGSPFPSGGRHCTIPAGTALFLALAARNQDNEGCSSVDDTRIERTSSTEPELRAFAHDALDSFLGSRRIVIDGVDVHGLPKCDPDHPTTCNSPYRVQSPVFDYTVPAFDNLLILDDGNCYKNPMGTGAPYTAHGAVADGVFVMIKPLEVGEHTVQFGLPDPTTGEPNRLYNITVTRARHDDDGGGDDDE